MVVFLQPAINLFVDVSIIALQLSRESHMPLFLLTTTEMSPEQPEKVHSGIVVTLSPIIRDEKLVQSPKASDPIWVHFSALKVTEVSAEQPRRALSGIDVTLLPIVRDEKLVQFPKTSVPILVHFSALKVTEVSPEQPEKA